MDKENTPKKVYNNCRLCGSNTSKPNKIFSKKGKEKELPAKIFKSVGIAFEESNFDDFICLKCERKVEDILIFQKKCHAAQTAQRVSVKRMVFLSPTHETSFKKRITEATLPSKAKKCLQYGTESNRTEITVNIKMPITAKDSGSVSLHHHMLKEQQPNILEKNINEKEHIDKLIYHIQNSCKHLCQRANGSILLNKDYDELLEFNHNIIWNEIVENHQFFIKFMLAMSGQDLDIHSVESPIKIKINFIYSILMNTRWHELSLFQRVNTVLLMEGGCSKQVCINIYLI